MSKHTPGPWGQDPQDWRCIRAVGGEGAVIADVMSPPHEEGREDAHLIAAAPDLLEAAEEVLFAIDSAPEFWKDSQLGRLRALHKAVAKAKGEA